MVFGCWSTHLSPQSKIPFHYLFIRSDCIIMYSCVLSWVCLFISLFVCLSVWLSVFTLSLFHISFFSYLARNMLVLDNYIIWNRMWCIKKLLEEIVPKLLDTSCALPKIFIQVKCVLKFIELICWVLILLVVSQYQGVSNPIYYHGGRKCTSCK